MIDRALVDSAIFPFLVDLAWRCTRAAWACEACACLALWLLTVDAAALLVVSHDNNSSWSESLVSRSDLFNDGMEGESTLSAN
jgi:hypothetical protein